MIDIERVKDIKSNIKEYNGITDKQLRFLKMVKEKYHTNLSDFDIIKKAANWMNGVNSFEGLSKKQASIIIEYWMENLERYRSRLQEIDTDKGAGYPGQ